MIKDQQAIIQGHILRSSESDKLGVGRLSPLTFTTVASRAAVKLELLGPTKDHPVFQVSYTIPFLGQPEDTAAVVLKGLVPAPTIERGERLTDEKLSSRKRGRRF